MLFITLLQPSKRPVFVVQFAIEMRNHPRGKIRLARMLLHALHKLMESSLVTGLGISARQRDGKIVIAVHSCYILPLGNRLLVHSEAFIFQCSVPISVL